MGKMLMYSKETRSRKQEIDHQHHTISNQRQKDKHYGNVHNRLFHYEEQFDELYLAGSESTKAGNNMVKVKR